MKSIFISASLFISTVSMASPSALIISTSSTGAVGYERTITVNDDGSVQEIVGSALAAGGPTKINLESLIPVELDQIKDKLSLIETDKPAIDPDQGAPYCANMSMSSVAIVVSGRVLTISSSGGCHTSSVPGSEDIVETMKSISQSAK